MIHCSRGCGRLVLALRVAICWFATLALASCSNDAGPESSLAVGAGGVPCAAGETVCNGVCVNTSSSPGNCGGCGMFCSADQVCNQGSCRPITEGCAPNLLLCGQSCVDPSADARNCGVCGNSCDVAHGVCQAGACSCDGGLTQCATDSCVDLLSDQFNCGSCSNACSEGEICTQGACACTAGLTDCFGDCVDPMTSTAHCGVCGTACAPTQVCNLGTCACPVSQTLCGDTCVDMLSDTSNCGTCGTTCSPTQICDQGSCTCPASEILCGDVCADTLVDTANCGMCGTACAATQICDQGTCACPEAQTLCTDTCVDLTADVSNCGTCGAACLERQLCVDGACECPAEETECGDTCVDTATDTANCGMCGNTCPEVQICAEGECVCPDGQSLCDGACIDTLTDDLNCGACGNECAFGEGCSMGECRGGAEGEDGCAGMALNIDLNEIAVYQTVKIPIMNNGEEVAAQERISDIISGRATLVRAFVTPGANWTPRELSARLFLQNPDSEIQVVYSTSTLMVRGASEEEQRDSTFEFNLEPEQVTPDTVYGIELVECGGGEGEESSPRYPSEGGLNLGARETRNLLVHVIPLRANGRVPPTDEAALQPYIDGFLASYPVNGIEISVGEPVEAPNDQDWNGMLDSVANARFQEDPGADVYYYGMLQPTETFQEYCGRGCVAGVGFVPQGQFGAEQARAALGLAYGNEASVLTMLHEVGHNHGRAHAPCSPGGIDGVDGNYPHAGGSVGVFGYDRRTDTITTPNNNTDIMGYCDNQWFSDYTYNGIMDEVLSLSQLQFTASVPDERIGTWHVLLVDPTFGARWGLPLDGPAVATGSPEQADVLDVLGNLVEQVTVYRTEVAHIDGYSIQVPEPQPGWHSIQIAGVPVIELQSSP